LQSATIEMVGVAAITMKVWSGGRVWGEVYITTRAERPIATTWKPMATYFHMSFWRLFSAQTRGFLQQRVLL